jgi:glc operon protein GlcG
MNGNTVLMVRLGVLALAATFAAPLACSAESAHKRDLPAGPQSLPGDNLPPFNMLDAGGRLKPPPPMPPGGLHRTPGAGPDSTAPAPSLELALEAAIAAVKDCTSRGYRGAATVVDSAGHARAMLSADGSDGSFVFVAQRKAITAVAFNMPSANVKASIDANPALLAKVTPAMFVQFGAYPIVMEGRLIGAIGYSGGDDEACAAAGLKAIAPKLMQQSTR